MADRENWPFLSILAWPEGWDRDRVADLLDPSFEFYSRWAAMAWRRAMTP